MKIHYNANDAWLHSVNQLLNPPVGIQYYEKSKPREMLTREIIGSSVAFQMVLPVVTCKNRGLSYCFMAAEALWVLQGSNDLNFHPQIQQKLNPYSDNGVTMSGAYGPMVMQQIRFVCETLHADINSRQAVMTIWKPNPSTSKDIPCTIGLQFMIREDTIHCMACMRSSDVWMGLPYDMFTFSCIANRIRLAISPILKLGTLTIFRGSSHLYKSNFEDAVKVKATHNRDENRVLGETKTVADMINWLHFVGGSETETIARERILNCPEWV